jgi:hypothetical protein
MSDTTLKFARNLVISSSEKVRIYHKIFSQKNYIAFERYIAKKKHWCALRWCKTPKLCISKLLHQRWSNLLSLPGTREKAFSFHFKRYNFTIRAVNFCKTFCNCSLSSLGRDPIVKSAIKWKKILELEMADLGCFLRKMGSSYRG